MAVWNKLLGSEIYLQTKKIVHVIGSQGSCHS